MFGKEAMVFNSAGLLIRNNMVFINITVLYFHIQKKNGTNVWTVNYGYRHFGRLEEDA